MSRRRQDELFVFLGKWKSYWWLECNDDFVALITNLPIFFRFFLHYLIIRGIYLYAALMMKPGSESLPRNNSHAFITLSCHCLYSVSQLNSYPCDAQLQYYLGWERFQDPVKVDAMCRRVGLSKGKVTSLEGRFAATVLLQLYVLLCTGWMPLDQQCRTKHSPNFPFHKIRLFDSNLTSNSVNNSEAYWSFSYM